MAAQLNENLGRSSLFKDRELPVDQPDIEKRNRFVDLKAEDIKRIASIRDLIIRQADQLTATFFDFLSHFNEAKSLFSSLHVLEEVKRLKKEHLIDMVNGDYGSHYVSQRIRLGRLYSKVGLEAKLFLGAYSHLIRTIGEQIIENFSEDPKNAFQNYLALQKVAFFDVGIIVDVLAFDREQMIRQQQEAIRELSTPVLQMRNQLLILPIVGVIDTYRARLLTENLLRSIRSNRAKVAVIDITGVATVDSKVANHIVQTVDACRLMGARVIVTGLSSEIAQTLVALGLELSKLNTVGDLQGGIEEAERYLGYKVTRESEPVFHLQ
jgi:rsbT co-antagonist protein RsbR